jgi:hypothetical protein
VPLARHQHTEVALDGTKHMHGTPATETEDLNRLGSAIVTKQVSTISRSSSTSLSRHACNQATDCSTPPPPRAATGHHRQDFDEVWREGGKRIEALEGLLGVHSWQINAFSHIHFRVNILYTIAQ